MEEEGGREREGEGESGREGERKGESMKVIDGDRLKPKSFFRSTRML